MLRTSSLLRAFVVTSALIVLAMALTVPWCYLVLRAAYDRDILQNAQQLARRVEQHFRMAVITARRPASWTLLEDPFTNEQDVDVKMRRTLGAEMSSDPTVETVVFYAVRYNESLRPPQPENVNMFAIVRSREKQFELINKGQIQYLQDHGILQQRSGPSHQFFVPWKQGGRVLGVTYIELSSNALYQEFWKKELPLLRQVIAWTASGVLALTGIGLFAYKTWRRVGRVRLQAELEQQGLLAERGLTAAVLAHEIRNPLAALRFQIHSLRKNADKPERIAGTAELIDAELSRIQQLVTDYLEHEKAVSLRVQSVDLEDAARKLHSLLEQLLRQTETELAIFGPAAGGHRVLVSCDPHALRQILMNLVLNAQQAMGRGGSIVIRIGRDDGFGTIDVADTGPGIPEEMRARIFKPFQTSKKEGHGIGLALVKRFVDNFGGSVTVESEIGKGTTFHLRLPLADGHGSPGDGATMGTGASGQRIAEGEAPVEASSGVGERNGGGVLLPSAGEPSGPAPQDRG